MWSCVYRKILIYVWRQGHFINIICGHNIRPCFFHNRNWDLACVSDYEGTKRWCEGYYTCLEQDLRRPSIPTKYQLHERPNFGQLGWWVLSTNDTSTISTQNFMIELVKQGLCIRFSSEVFARILRWIPHPNCLFDACGTIPYLP